MTPITSVDFKKIGKGKPGPITKTLASKYSDVVLGTIRIRRLAELHINQDEAMEEFIDEVNSSGNFVAKRKREDLKKKMFMHKVALVIPKAESGRISCRKGRRTSTHSQTPGAARSEAR